MKAQSIPPHDAPHQFEPLMPADSVLGPLLERASDLTRATTALGATSGKTAQTELRALLRSMNSYYTNRIEGDAHPPQRHRACPASGFFHRCRLGAQAAAGGGPHPH